MIFIDKLGILLKKELMTQVVFFVSKHSYLNEDLLLRPLPHSVNIELHREIYRQGCVGPKGKMKGLGRLRVMG